MCERYTVTNLEYPLLLLRGSNKHMENTNMSNEMIYESYENDLEISLNRQPVEMILLCCLFRSVVVKS